MENINTYKEQGLLDFISSLLKDDVDYDHFISHLRFGPNLISSIQSQFPNEQTSFIKRNSFVTKEDYITFALGHISTDPQNSELSYLLKNLYIYDEEGPNDILKPSINLNENSVNLFYNELKDSCNALRKSIRKNEKNNPHIFYVESDRGAGKTFFINHFFTKFNDKLAINDRILWIRVDLDLNFAEFEIDILKYIGAKLLKIILKHYCRHSKYNMDFFISQVKDKIYGIANVEDFFKTNLLTKFYTLVAKFHNNQSLEGAYDDFDETLIDIMYNVLNIYEYKTIFIIDNIDLLDKSHNRIEKFHHYLNQIKLRVIPTLCNNGVFMITYRSNIHNYLTKQIAASGKGIFAPFYHRLNVVGFEKIFLKKEELLFDRVSTLGSEKSRAWDLSDWPEQLYDFEDFITNSAESKSIADYINFLEQSFGYNNRSKTQMVQLLYQAFILSRNNKVRYKFIEYLFLSGNRFPPKVFNYKLVSNKLLLERVEKVYDNIFVPNLFVYPYHHNITNCSMPFSQSYLLVKFRIIQVLLCAYSNCLERGGIIKVGDITSILSKNFNYDVNIILLCIDEFFELEFIRIEDDDNISFVSNNTQILITPKFITFFTELSNVQKSLSQLNYFNLFNDIAYLNLCAMRIDVSSNKSGKDSIFYSLPYDNIFTSKQQTLEWVKIKIVNSVLLLKYIIEIEKYENNRLLTNDDIPENAKTIIYKFPKLSSILSSNIESQIKSSISNLDDKELEFIEPQIKKHFVNLFIHN